MGNDGKWFTEDDVIGNYYFDTYDSSGNNIKRINYGNNGNDGYWFTNDDEIANSWFGAYAKAKYPEDMVNGWIFSGSSLIFTSYNDPGIDNKWFTDDDIIKIYQTHEFENGLNKFWTKEINYFSERYF